MSAAERIVAFVASTFTGLFGVAWLLSWVAGCVLAKGFWSTFFAVATWGLWSAYLVVEKVMLALGWA